MGVYAHNPRRDVNKYMHKREIDARFGEIGGREGGDVPRLVHGVAGSYTTTENCGGKRECKMERAVFLNSAPAANRDRDSYKQPLLASTGHDRIDATPGRTEPHQS